jgi:glycosyltransferase involved in cell wall biosynthesis
MTLSKKNIAIISPNYNAYSETFIQEHKKLHGNIYFYYGNYTPTHLEGYGEINHKGLRYIFYLILKGIGFTSIPSFEVVSLKRNFKKNKIDLVFAEYGPTGAHMLNICSDLKIPLLVHFHGYDASQNDIIRNYEMQYKEVFLYASYIFVVSMQMQKQLVKLGCPSEKIVLNTYGPSQLFFTVKPTYNTQQFLSVGRFVDKKAPYLTILAFRKVVDAFPHAKLVMIGDGHLFGTCINIVHALDLAENVVFLGPKSPEEISEYMKSSLAFVQHSMTASNGDSEGTPIAILEAQAAALPVVSTIHAGIPEVVINNESGFLVQEGDVLGMAMNMIKFLNDPSLARKFGETGRNYVMKKFDLNSYLETISNHIVISLDIN